MKKIYELIEKRFGTERFDRNKGVLEKFDPTAKSGKTEPLRFEHNVFLYLDKNKESLGIESIYKAKSLRIDGVIVLKGGRRLAIEIKYRINWEKACVCKWEIEQFLKESKENNSELVKDIKHAIVFFEEFSGSWKSTAKKRKHELGWTHWYGAEGYAKVKNLRVDLFRLKKDKGIEFCPISG